MVGALSHSGKAVAGRRCHARSRKTQYLSLEKEQLEAGAKPAGVSPFSNWDISPYTGSGSSDVVVDGTL